MIVASLQRLLGRFRNSCGYDIPLYLGLLLCVYIVYGTGIFSDDYALSQSPNHFQAAIAAPVLFFIREGFYGFIAQERYGYIELIKSFVVGGAFFLSYHFFKIFHERVVAFVAAFLFVFLPIHDGATFWYTGQSYLLTGAFYFYAYVLLHRGRSGRAIALAFIASFTGYGSTPYALGMAYLAYRKIGMKPTMIMLAPNVIYIIYYVVLTKFIGIGISRLPDHMNLLVLSKQFILQVVTGVDALVGPSLWLKLVLSVFEVTWVSILIALVATFFLNIQNRSKPSFPQVDRDLLVSFLIVMVSSWAMFAMTGYYPQIAFNLGDRVTLWGSLLVAYLVACWVFRNRVIFGFAMGFLMLSVLGNAEHWKDWNLHQLQVINNIRSNPGFSQLSQNDMVFVIGNHYSKLGPISNIEFMSEAYSTSSVFRHALRDHYNFHAIPLSHLDKYKSGVLVDIKNNSRYALGEEVYIYDSVSNQLVSVRRNKLSDLLISLPNEHRHWIQLLDQGVFYKLATILMPRLQYAQ